MLATALDHQEKIFGLIIPRTSPDCFGSIINNFEKELSVNGCSLFVSVTNSEIEKEQRALQEFSKIADGIFILSSALDYADIADYVPDNIPVIFIYRKPANIERTAIVTNDYTSIHQAVVFYMSQGFDKIGFINSINSSTTSNQRFENYKSALESTGITFDENNIFTAKETMKSLYQLTEKIEQSDCKAFLVSNHSLTQQLVNVLLMKYSSKIPSFFITGVSGEATDFTLLNSIDSIHAPMNQYVDLALQQMFYQLNHPDTPPKTFLVKSRFQRGTYGAFYLSDSSSNFPE